MALIGGARYYHGNVCPSPRKASGQLLPLNSIVDVYHSATMISLSDMMRFFKDEDKSVQRGENPYKSGHVLTCSVYEGQLVGSVRASMKDKIYRVVVSFAGCLAGN